MAGCGDLEGLFQPTCCCGSVSLDLMIHEHVRYGLICLKKYCLLYGFICYPDFSRRCLGRVSVLLSKYFWHSKIYSMCPFPCWDRAFR